MIFPDMRKTSEELFWERCALPDTQICWPWQGAKNPIGGYGIYAGKLRITSHREHAHKVAHRLWYGKGNRYVLHRCGNSACCNPFHLYDGSAWQNARDRDRMRPHP